jgi:hypothetical protein
LHSVSHDFFELLLLLMLLLRLLRLLPMFLMLPMFLILCIRTRWLRFYNVDFATN